MPCGGDLGGQPDRHRVDGRLARRVVDVLARHCRAAAARDDTLTMTPPRPPRAVDIRRTAAPATRNAPITLRRTTASRRSAVYASTRPGRRDDAGVVDEQVERAERRRRRRRTAARRRRPRPGRPGPRRRGRRSASARGDDLGGGVGAVAVATRRRPTRRPPGRPPWPRRSPGCRPSPARPGRRPRAPAWQAGAGHGRRGTRRARGTVDERTAPIAAASGSRAGRLGRVAPDAVSPRARHRSPGDRPHPGLRHGRPAAGQQRPPGHGDGARPAGQRPLQPHPEARSRPTRRGPTATASCCPTGTPRSSSTRCCTCAATASSSPTSRRSASTSRARPATPRPATRPGIEVTTGPARPGLRRRRRHGDRRARAARAVRQPPRRPPHVRHRRRRVLHGGRQPRGGVARRPPRPGPADLRVRRQPGHDRRLDRAVELRRRRPALRGLRLARRVPRRDRRRLRRPRGRAASRPAPTRRRPSLLVLRSHIGTPSPDHTDDPAAHGNPFTAEDVDAHQGGDGHPRRAVLGARRTSSRRTGKPSAARGPRTPRPAGTDALDALDGDERAAWDAAWHGTGTKGWEDALPTFEPGEKIATRQAMAKVLGAVHRPLPRPRVGRGRPHRQHRRQAARRAPASRRPTTPAAARSTTASASTAWARPPSAWPCTAGSCPSPARSSCSSTTCARRCASPACRGPRRCSCSATTRSASARTARRTSRSSTWRRCGRSPTLQVIRPADGNETAAAFRAAVDHDDGPTVIVLSRQGLPTRTDGSAVERGAGIVADVADPALVIVATGSEVWVAMDAAERLTGEGVADPRRQPAELGPLRRPGPRATATSCCRRACRCCRSRPRTTFGWARYADDSIGIDRFGVSAPGDEVLDRLGHQRRARGRAGPGARRLST